MGLSSTTNRVGYTGDGTTTSFAFAYSFPLQNHLVVYLYDTVLGTATLQTLNSNYTISGTPNSQGLYVNGANVVFSVAPTTTQIVVIFRSPSFINNYSLLQNQNISSAALVQQMDYLTMICQRLEDQVSRAVMASDGMGKPFNGAIPSNLALKPLSYLQVNSTGDGIQLSDTAGWNKVSFTYAQVQAGALTNTLTLFTLPKGSMLRGVVIKSSTAFTGVGITTLSAQVGVSGTAGMFINYYDLIASVADGNFDSTIDNYIASFVNATNISVTFTATGANLSALTAGAVDVYYQYQNIA